MNGYNYGTGARKYEQSTHTEHRKVQKTARKIDKAFVFCFLIAAALAFTLLGRYALITEKTAQIENLKAELEVANSMVVSEEFELEKSVDLKTVEEIATTKLGMQRPEKHQMVYISMDNGDWCEVCDEKSSGFLASMAAGVLSIVEYFR